MVNTPDNSMDKLRWLQVYYPLEPAIKLKGPYLQGDKEDNIICNDIYEDSRSPNVSPLTVESTLINLKDNRNVPVITKQGLITLVLDIRHITSKEIADVLQEAQGGNTKLLYLVCIRPLPTNHLFLKDSETLKDVIKVPLIQQNGLPFPFEKIKTYKTMDEAVVAANEMLGKTAGTVEGVKVWESTAGIISGMTVGTVGFMSSNNSSYELLYLVTVTEIRATAGERKATKGMNNYGSNTSLYH